MTYKNILFDLDGTLTDPKEGITKSVAYALRHYGIEVSGLDTLIPFIGPPLVHSFHKYYGFDEQQGLEAVEVYRAYFKDTGIFENRVYDGIIPMLEHLKAGGRRLFVATSKPEVFAVRIAQKFGFEHPFERIRGIPLDGENMTKGEVIASLVQAYALDPSETLMVGDRMYDAEGAKQNGIDCVGVLYGYGDRQELEAAGAKYIVETVAELQEFLDEHY